MKKRNLTWDYRSVGTEQAYERDYSFCKESREKRVESMSIIIQEVSVKIRKTLKVVTSQENPY